MSAEIQMLVGTDAPQAALSDVEIGARFARGEADAVHDLYIRWAQHIYDFAATIVHDRSLAQDVTQQTFIRAIEARGSLRDPSRVRSWLYTIARNLALKQLAGNRRLIGDGDETLALLPADDEPEMEVIGSSVSDLVWAAAKSLESRQFTLLNLMLRHDCDAAEIAEVMGISTNHAYVLSHRSKEALGNAVRTLLLAKSSHDCARLSALLPDNFTALTPAVHRSVEHHLRRCDDCKSRAAQLTQASALFSAIPLLALPRVLNNPPRILYATTTAARIDDHLAVQRSRRRFGHGLLAVLIALLLAVGGASLIWPFRSHPAQQLAKHGATQAAAVLTANEAIARTVKAIEAASSYHVTGSATNGSTVNDFSVTVSRSGDFSGTVSINHPSFSGEQPITQANGTLYARGDGTAPTPYVSGMFLPNEPMRVFGLTEAQATNLGTQWFSLDGAAQLPAGQAITSGLAPFDTPAALVASLFPSDQTATFGGTSSMIPSSSAARHNAIVLRLSSGASVTLDPTTFLPTSAVLPGVAGVVTFSNWNASASIAVPSPILPLS